MREWSYERAGLQRKHKYFANETDTQQKIIFSSLSERKPQTCEVQLKIF
jgi:hypothetical protein